MNSHGLDARYFKEKLGQLVRDADNYTPKEMQTALERLAVVACPHRFMFFGDQAKRRCADCSTVEPSA